MSLDLLLFVGRREGGLELGALAIPEHHGEHVERELRATIGEMLRLGREDAELQLAASLHRLEVESAILVALSLCGREPLLELVESLDDLLDARHASFMIDARSTVNAKRESRSLCDAAKDRRERASIDRRQGPVRAGRLGQLEERAVQALVEQAVAVVVEPENLEAVASPAREHEERAALWIEREPLSNRQRERVE
ncbi:MAG TPA: hypothetical protein VIJ50_07450 [Solirubrobacteraceae bacterium]